MKLTRRDFLKELAEKGAHTFVFGNMICMAAAFTFPKTSKASSSNEKRQGNKGTAKDTTIYGFVVNVDKCIGCGSCVRADKAENKVPEGFFRTWVERYTFFECGEAYVDSPKGAVEGFKSELTGKHKHEGCKVERGFFVPKLCNHCINTPCIQVCPVGASFKTEEGVVLIDSETCIGCAYCVQACPFGTRYLNHETGVADKCNWCYHRITKGLKPACVEACPTGSRIFGNVSDPKSEISKILKSNRTQVLKSFLGTNPRTRYIGLDSEVI